MVRADGIDRGVSMGVLDRFRLDDKVAIVTGASSGPAWRSPKRWPKQAPTSRSWPPR